ncbi:MAG: M20 family peptidase [Chloroflexi bacterium]|nr:MAG: M20 family peptidase [Chloroflexota bacterium]
MPDSRFTRLDEIILRNRDEQIAFLQALVRTRSANPFIPDTSDPDEPIERAVATMIDRQLRAIGMEPEFKGVSMERPNVVAVLRGTGRKRALILNGHMDTVMPSPLWTLDPFGGTIRDGRLYGLGALDMKASLSVFVYVAKALLEAEIALAGDLILTFVVDEEPGGCSRFGTSYLLENGVTGTAVIIAEPESTNVTIGHRGGYRFRLITRGEATHTGLEAWERGEKGKNAITDMARAITALQGLALPFDRTPAFPGRKPVLTFPTLIQGGVSINAVPDQCVAYGDVRLLPGCDADTVERRIRAALDAVPGLDYALERLLFVPAVEIAPDEEIVRVLARHTAVITGQMPTRLGCGPWNDGWMFITRGIPAICGFGPTGAGVHGPDEYVELDSVIDVTRIVARAVIDYLDAG